MRKIENVFYLSHNSKGRFLDLNYEEALKRYEENDCFLMMSKTKDLFPKFKVVKETPCNSNNLIFIVRKKTRL